MKRRYSVRNELHPRADIVLYYYVFDTFDKKTVSGQLDTEIEAIELADTMNIAEEDNSGSCCTEDY